MGLYLHQLVLHRTQFTGLPRVQMRPSLEMRDLRGTLGRPMRGVEVKSDHTVL